ncbi:MAG: hypothetical protein JW779_05385 [Candidatus Thorarchaeota archaeon]|nr:hypothetical protein [Candidatus Thorarchaeota archaeon]
MLDSEDPKIRQGQRSRTKLLVLLILVLFILVPLLLAAYLYYLPLNDVKAKVDYTYRNYEEEYNFSEVVLLTNVTNSGAISHGFLLTGKVIFITEPDTIFTYTYRMRSMDAGETYPEVRIRVPVTNELLPDDYDTSVSVELLPLFNDDNRSFMVIAGVVWLVALAAAVMALIHVRRDFRQ